MKTEILKSTVAFTALVLLGLGTAGATTITGSLWAVPEATAQNAIPANVPGTTPDVTFELNAPASLDFDAEDATVGAWLATGSALNIVENTPGTLSHLMDDGTDTQGTLVQFLGMVTVTTGQMFTVSHDDGLTLIIGGVDLGFDPGPTSPTVSSVTYGGPSGTFPFQLVYGECCGGPAVLKVDLPFEPPAAPEPGTLGLVAGGLLLGAIRRRVR